MVRHPGRIGCVVVVVLLLAAGAFLALKANPPISVRAVQPTLDVIEEIVTATTVGSVEARQTATVRSETTGRVIRIRHREGPVEAEQVVIEIDPADLETERGRVVHERRVAELEGSRAKDVRERAEDALKRQEGLDPSIRIEQDFERLRKDLEIARKDVQIAEARLQVLEATLQQVELRLKKTKVPSPFTGMISKLQTEVGETVAVGAPLFCVVSSDPPLIRAPIDEVDMGRIFTDCAARVRFDAYPARTVKGEVVQIFPTASTDARYNRTVDVRVRLEAIPENILPGMSAHVELIPRKREGAWVLPSHAVHEEVARNVTYVYVVEAGRARRREIVCGLSNWKFREVLQGLTGESQVILPDATEEGTLLEEGSPVIIDEK